MSYKKSSIDIIGEAVASMTFPVSITNVVQTGSVFTLTVCDIYHAQIGYEVVIGGNTYTITDVIAPGTLVVKGSAPIVVKSFMLYNPFYFHGTPIERNIDLVQTPSAFDKTPMIWFLENFVDKFYDDPENVLDREIDCRIFFLSQANHEEWKVDEAYEKCILPMRRLMENFLKHLRKTKNVFDMLDFEYDAINYAKFGVYITNKGTEKNMFADKLAGCEISANFKIYKHTTSNCEPDCIT